MKQFPAVVGGVVLLGVLTLGATAATTIEDYTVYGHKGVFIGVGSTVYGLTGAGTNDPITQAAIKLNGAAKIDGDARSGGNVSLANSVHITGTVFRPAGTTLTKGAGSTVGADVIGDPMLPVFPPATPLVCPTGGANYLGANSQTLPLGPGSYGALKFGASLSLILNGAGDYFFDSISTANGAKLFVSPGVNIYVCGSAEFGSVNVFPTNLSPCDFSIEVQAAGLNAFKAGGASHWIGNVFAPNGQIHVGSGSSAGASVVGQLIGNSIDIEHGLTITNVECMAEDCDSPCIVDARLLEQGRLEITGNNLGLLSCIMLYDANNDIVSLGQLQCGSGDCNIPVVQGVSVLISLNPDGTEVLTTIFPTGCGPGTYRVLFDTGGGVIVSKLLVTIP